MHQILIVDEEEHLLWALEKNLLPERDDIKVITANGGEAGLELLRSEQIDVLICDIKMPGSVDGFQLILRAKEIAPDARVVIMTAFGSNRIQNLAERVGITHYVEKPFNISDLRNVVLELLDAKEGFQGVLSDLELTDIIQMLCLAKRTALLHLKHRDHRGKIVFERGDVTHAEFNDVQGEAAVYQMLALRQGDIYMQSDFHNTQHTIHVGWQDLLLEGMRRADEHRADASDLEEESDALDDGALDDALDGMAGVSGSMSALSGANGAADLNGLGLEPSSPGVFEDSGEITLGMPPRLVSRVEESELGDEPSGSFFTDEELAEIESAGRELSGTANGFDRLLDQRTRELIEQHEQRAVEAARTQSEPFQAPKPAGLEEFSQPMPGRPTDSSDFPAQPRQELSELSEVSSPSGSIHPAPSLVTPAIQPEPPRPSYTPLSSPAAPPARQSAPTPGGLPPAGTPSVVAQEIRPRTFSGGHIAAPKPSPAMSGGWSTPPSPLPTNTRRQMAPTLMLQSPGILSSRNILQEFARECHGVSITGLFSFDDGMALDFHAMPGARYEEDVLSAFFRDVAACAELTARALFASEGGFEELQITMERELFLLRRIHNTPYVHIAAMDRNVRLGIAIVLMRRYGDRLAECFNR